MIKNKKRKIRNYTITGVSGITGLGVAEGIFYGIPKLSQILPGWAIALFICLIMLLAMLFAFLVLSYIANIRDAELRRRLKTEELLQYGDQISRANGLQGLIPDDDKTSLLNKQNEIKSQLYDREQHEKAMKMKKKF
ncbi:MULTISPECIES: hypothetical protein [unclassified Spiroplasma]|uniref:hypothetical protein n=1 Tax=unclassified Spiroplasma TaxID=2637901 RepID=UPI0030CE0C3F